MSDAAWLVVGADGGIGRPLLARLRADGRAAVGTTRRGIGDGLQLDLSADPDSWQIPVHVAVAYLCAAVTSIDACRRDPAGTRGVNVDQTLALAARLRERGAHVVFLSTNQVFDGTVPFRCEADTVCPLTEYGRQKSDAETALLATGAATVVRFTKVVPPDWSLIHKWRDALSRGEPVEAFGDMVLSPVPLGIAVEALARVGEKRPGGVIHVSGTEDCTYAELARRLAVVMGADQALVRAVSCRDRGIPAEAAPAHTALATARLSRELGLAAPTATDLFR
ncbi:SDR family oxidoreductase [Urbifossiella limnaea]|uniref:dTDP-4-dehydrorhamnose reductase n=1 Tax=Urbifossiella limnaea TaxID=2528023 RepID=A0A517XQU9_9BACT|nr:sugar nucleotide-binding protein [Urbifossiella limnaea]QDU19890.1 dTDP-4-dehydrorhamnose reductase [Urbifossiella limnaea]